MKKYQKELILILIVLTPLIYLAFKWWNLPQEIILHKENGEVDSQFSRFWLLLISFGNIVFYLIMLIWPKIDPRKRIEEMGNKYFIMRLLYSFYFTVFITYFIISAANDCPPNNRAFFVFAGVMLAIIGNYMQTVRPNYFLGWRTPWTLESEYVWKQTHRIGGRLLIIAGTIILLVSIFSPEFWIPLTCIVISISQILFIYVYSYILFQKEKKRVELETFINENNNAID